jgi:ferredoxin-NADP reductase
MSTPPEAVNTTVHDSRTPSEATIEHIVTHNTDTRSFFLRPMNGQRLVFKPGQFISLLLPVGGEILTRPYSIASSPEDGDLLEICLNLVPGGPGSHYLFARSISEKVNFTGPWGTFVLDQLLEAECVFIADGTGIAPIRPMIRRVLARGSQFPLRLLYGATKEGNLLYRNELEAWEREHGGFVFEPVLQNPPPGWTGLRGALLENVERYFVKQDPDRTRQFYICGVGELVLRLRDLLRGAGYQRRAVQYEKW